MSIDVPGTEGYAEHAEALANDWHKISFQDHHRPVLHLIPSAPSRILDVGAGMGRDAAAFASMGHSVVAVEPVDALRAAAINFYSTSSVVWLDDSLPELRLVRERANTFNVVMVTAVWMHLDEVQRCRAMGTISDLLVDGGLVIMSLRHGPFPKGRRMFDVSAEDTIELAAAHGLHLLLNVCSGSAQQANRNMGITWTRLAFRK
ncbi:class I SAM-dependent methyltransferase [Paraburkholderia sp. MMS20-SJTR3]|uniref:Class I SAM-dependent methyltransferase n=1 Tax=Paraburkholderia sejongensis TaxID=2886946 RepID=A0ABS8JTD5_9BURK|nr:class I SAM-dependent methyltransferase [Paraburkholderia sp. MMS20-SJTR3]MCC8393170.1 class I SAM-dependent methyltransferase [Paraburkholderia sp. MMS20-SJTR3]